MFREIDWLSDKMFKWTIDLSVILYHKEVHSIAAASKTWGDGHNC